MITFNVVKEKYGWAVRMGDYMTTPFWSRELAILEANALARELQCHGQCAKVTIEGVVSGEQLPKLDEPVSSWLSVAFSQGRRTATQ